MAKTRPSSNFYRNVRVKVYGNGYNQLVGLPWLSSQFDNVLLHKILETIDNSLLDKVSLKFRRGLKVTIYFK